MRVVIFVLATTLHIPYSSWSGVASASIFDDFVETAPPSPTPKDFDPFRSSRGRNVMKIPSSAKSDSRARGVFYRFRVSPRWVPIPAEDYNDEGVLPPRRWWNVTRPLTKGRRSTSTTRRRFVFRTTKSRASTSGRGTTRGRAPTTIRSRSSTSSTPGPAHTSGPDYGDSSRLPDEPTFDADTPTSSTDSQETNTSPTSASTDTLSTTFKEDTSTSPSVGSETAANTNLPSSDSDSTASTELTTHVEGELTFWDEHDPHHDDHSTFAGDHPTRPTYQSVSTVPSDQFPTTVPSDQSSTMAISDQTTEASTDQTTAGDTASTTVSGTDGDSKTTSDHHEDEDDHHDDEDAKMLKDANFPRRSEKYSAFGHRPRPPVARGMQGLKQLQLLRLWVEARERQGLTGPLPLPKREMGATTLINRNPPYNNYHTTVPMTELSTTTIVPNNPDPPLNTGELTVGNGADPNLVTPENIPGVAPEEVTMESNPPPPSEEQAGQATPESTMISQGEGQQETSPDTLVVVMAEKRKGKEYTPSSGDDHHEDDQEDHEEDEDH